MERPHPCNPCSRQLVLPLTLRLLEARFPEHMLRTVRSHVCCSRLLKWLGSGLHMVVATEQNPFRADWSLLGGPTEPMRSRGGEASAKPASTDTNSELLSFAALEMSLSWMLRPDFDAIFAIMILAAVITSEPSSMIGFHSNFQRTEQCARVLCREVSVAASATRGVAPPGSQLFFAGRTGQEGCIRKVTEVWLPNEVFGFSFTPRLADRSRSWSCGVTAPKPDF